MDPNKPGGSVAGGPPEERGVRPSCQFNIPRDEYYDKSGVFDARWRLESYCFNNGLSALNNVLATTKTADPGKANDRLASFALVGDTLLDGYANGPSRTDRWRTTIGKQRVLHRFARRIANL